LERRLELHMMTIADAQKWLKKHTSIDEEDDTRRTMNTTTDVVPLVMSDMLSQEAIHMETHAMPTLVPALVVVQTEEVDETMHGQRMDGKIGVLLKEKNQTQRVVWAPHQAMRSASRR
jgi:hypothetical protein